MITTLTILSAKQGLSYKAPSLDQFDDRLLADIGVTRAGVLSDASSYTTSRARQGTTKAPVLAGFAAAITRLMVRSPASRQVA